MTFFGWMKCDACDVRWLSEPIGTSCWNCGKPGERCFVPYMNQPGYWIADRNDPLPDQTHIA